MASNNKKKKGETKSFIRLQDDLKKKAPANLYFFYGDETYTMQQYVEKLRNLLIVPGTEDFNLHRLYNDECTPESLGEAVDAIPMMAERSLVLVSDYNLFGANKDTFDEYTQILSDLPDYVCVVFIFDAIKLEPNGKKQNANENSDSEENKEPEKSPKVKLKQIPGGVDALIEFSAHTNSDLTRWIVSTCKKENVTISSKTAEHLLEYVGDSLGTLNSEVAKLCAYTKNGEIHNADIDAVCIPTLDAISFKLTDALMAGNKGTALKVLSDLFQMQQDAKLTLGSISSQIRIMYFLRLAKDKNIQLQDAYEMIVPPKEDKRPPLPYPYIKSSGIANKFSVSWYHNVFRLITEADRRLKRFTGDEQDVLTDLLLRIMELDCR